jgi:hypothetical protein
MKTKSWKLPRPLKKKKTYEFVPVVRIGRTVPFGYRQDPDDCDILLPIPEELELFEEAKEHLKKYSYREVAAWLTQASGRSISHVGLYKRVKLEQKRKDAASIYRFWAKKYEEAAEKAKKLEENRIGARRDIVEGDDSSNTETRTD